MIQEDAKRCKALMIKAEMMCEDSPRRLRRRGHGERRFRRKVP
jgi:hypothetical protein